MKIIKILLAISLVCILPIFPVLGYGLVITLSQAKWLIAAKCVGFLAILSLAAFIAIAHIWDL
jgi:hypothetical protein